MLHASRVCPVLLALAFLICPASVSAEPLDECHTGVVLKLTTANGEERSGWDRPEVVFLHADGRRLHSTDWETRSRSWPPQLGSIGCGLYRDPDYSLAWSQIAAWAVFEATKGEIMAGHFVAGEGIEVELVRFVDGPPIWKNLHEQQGLALARTLFADAQSRPSRGLGRTQAYNALSTIDYHCDDCGGPDGVALRAEIEEWISASRLAEAMSLIQQGESHPDQAIQYLGEASIVLYGVPEDDPRYAKAANLRAQVEATLEAVALARL